VKKERAVKMPFAKRRSMVRRVLGSNELTGMVVRYGGLALLALLFVSELPAIVRYVNIERM
jgi:hypothetical protein